jgi:urea carboxylase
VTLVDLEGTDLATGDGPDIEVRAGGPFTTVQDVPGRMGYWHVGVPPSGPMDDLSHRLANRIVGNAEHAAALELTSSGPELHFPRGGVVALAGADMAVTVDGSAVPCWEPVTVPAGSTLAVGPVRGAGLRATLAVRGGIEAPPYLGSRSTFTLARFGGLDGRPLAAGDALHLAQETAGDPCGLSPGMAPRLTHEWEVGVLIGPHTAPEFLTAAGLDALLRTVWGVDANSARTGVRLLGPKPRWARSDGGDAGLHPSNIHDTGYAIGSVDLTGDMPVILGPDGPSLGGFVCPAVVAEAERWKLGQLRPGDAVRLVPWTLDQATEAGVRRRSWLERATDRIEPLARPTWNTRPSGTSRAEAETGVLARDEPSEQTPAVTYRQAGDRFLLVEFGDMVLDLQLRLRVQALDRWVRAHLGPGLVDATTGVRSLLIQVDGRHLTTTTALHAIREACAHLGDLADEAFPSRVVHLPLSWDDPATREAIERYVNGVRSDAPWCPWNIEFIRRINGLASVDDVRRIVFDASYLVLGLGDVYLGAPLATPLDPRHRLVTTKYNPARTWTAENSVGIGGSYLCIYGMEGPGGYQFVGRTVQVWNRDALGPHFDEPWLLRPFDQLRWHPVSADRLLELRDEQSRGELAIDIEETSFRLRDHEQLLADEHESIDRFRRTQRAAFEVERQAWADAGEFDDLELA